MGPGNPGAARRSPFPCGLNQIRFTVAFSTASQSRLMEFSGRKIYAGKGERRRVLEVHTTTQNMGMDGLGKNLLSVSTFILFSGGNPLRKSCG